MRISGLGTKDQPALFDDMIALNEYLLVVPPPDFVCDATWERKNLLRRLIGSFEGEFSRAISRCITGSFHRNSRSAIGMRSGLPVRSLLRSG